METSFPVDLSSNAAWCDAAKSVSVAGGLFVAHDGQVEPFRQVQLVLQCPGESIDIAGTIVNIPAAGGGFYVQLTEGAELERLRDVLSGTPPDEPTVEESSVEAEEGAGEAEEGTKRPTPTWDLIDPTSDEPLHSQVRKLTVAQKIKLARTANRPARELLIRDADKRVHVEVVRNPKTTEEEIVSYTAIPTLSPKVLEWVSKQSKHMRRRAVMINIIQNPMTPQETAKRLLPKLRDQELLRISRSSKVREVLSRQAKRILMQKGVL